MEISAGGERTFERRHDDNGKRPAVLRRRRPVLGSGRCAIRCSAVALQHRTKHPCLADELCSERKSVRCYRCREQCIQFWSALGNAKFALIHLLRRNSRCFPISAVEEALPPASLPCLRGLVSLVRCRLRKQERKRRQESKSWTMKESRRRAAVSSPH